MVGDAIGPTGDHMPVGRDAVGDDHWQIARVTVDGVIRAHIRDNPKESGTHRASCGTPPSKRLSTGRSGESSPIGSRPAAYPA
jgi:hypothetical protein